ncbi:MAG TPA: hypothetical protein VKU01_32015 [Bryobacteraceae bacterium]|nr:hypothetical protein [Bryobacteraceae bacterium]
MGFHESPTGVTATYAAHPHFCDAVNHNIIQSEIEGGVFLRDLPAGSRLTIETKNRFYTLVVLGEEAALISGHPEYCPDPALVQIHGSTWGGSMLKTRFIGRGMHLEFDHPVYHTVVTSQIIDIRAH